MKIAETQSSHTSFCVADPEITEVIDLESGELLSASQAIGNDYLALEQLRMRLATSVAKDERLYACAVCGTSVYLVCQRHGDDKRFHFRHTLEDGRCPALTRGALTEEQMRACKYNGAKESQAHIRMKEIIAQSLACDPDFSEPDVERVWKGQDRKSWRKPDVSAVWRGTIRVAFEIQLSTTFLHVIAERRQFYLDQGGLLCWVFQKFDADAARMTQDDVFFNNNQNLFLASEETLGNSKEQDALVLGCRWTLPAIDKTGKVTEQWDGRSARFSELTLDQAKQRVFLVDCESKRKHLLAEAANAPLRRQFEQWWTAEEPPALNGTWHWFRDEFWKRGIALPEWPSHLYALLNALYTAKAGRPVRYRHPKFISVLHTVADSHRRVIQPLRAALLVYDRAQQVREEDSSERGEREGKWAKKAREYRERMREGDTAYDRERRFDPLVAFLFPEVGAQLCAWDAEEKAK